MPTMNGAIRISMYTPALTMVDEWSSAETGVGATMAPVSQELKGMSADLVNAPKARKANGSTMAAAGRNDRKPGMLAFMSAGRTKRSSRRIDSMSTDADDERDAAQQVHPQRLIGRLDGYFVPVMPDEQERAERGDLPEEEQPGQVVGEDQGVHVP